MEDPSTCFHQPHCILQVNSHELLFAQYLLLCVLWLPFSCSPKDHISANLQILQIWICSPVHVVCGGREVFEAFAFYSKTTQILETFYSKTTQTSKSSLSKQFLHFILTVTTANIQRFKRKWCLLTLMIIFFWPSSKSDSMSMNFKQLVNSVTFLLCSIYDNM